MRVSLAFVAHRVNVSLRFGQPDQETVLDRRRRVAVFAPGALCCRVKWIGNDHGIALWQLMVLQAPVPFEAMRVDPCAVAVTYWRIVGNRMAARQLPPASLLERRAAHLARRKLQ